jgi:hypothetical protein
MTGTVGAKPGRKAPYLGRGVAHQQRARPDPLASSDGKTFHAQVTNVEGRAGYDPYLYSKLSRMLEQNFVRAALHVPPVMGCDSGALGEVQVYA